MRIRFSYVMRALLLAGALGLASTPAAATVITGELNIIGGVRVDADQIDFLPLAGGTGAFLADPFTQEGVFTAYANTPGVIKDLTSANSSVGSSFTLPEFITLSAWPGFGMTLEFIRPGVFSADACDDAPAAGQTCTPALPVGLSPFNLTNVTATSSTASFSVRGIASDGSGDPISTFTGTFTTQFSNKNLQQVLAAIESGSSVDASFSANFVFTPVPEPSTVAMMLIGGAAVLVGARRRK